MPSVLRISSVLTLFVATLLPAQTSRTPVLVELFTSEGCSSCPPADRLLAALNAAQPIAGADIIALEEHVDYWDGIGWKDRFSSSTFTDRQNLYAPKLGFDSPYTPQMVIDGRYQFVGNDAARATANIAKSATAPKSTLALSPSTISGRKVNASVSLTGGQPLPNGDLYAVLVQPSATTQVRGGENGGRKLEHVSIARAFSRIGRSQDLAKSPIPFSLTAPPDTDPSSLRLVVFAQLPSQGGIFAIAQSHPSH
ncbi:MAG TPA: DUF1223 domain-containing protein [Edaphobacter sp.]